MEVNGKDFYLALSESAREPEISKLLEGLAEMEDEHTLYISGKISEIRSKYPELPEPPKITVDLYDRRYTKMNFDKGGYDEKLTAVLILRMAYYIERDFMDFYQKAANVNSGDVKKVFEDLMTWEVKHLMQIKEAMDKLIKEKGLNPDIYALEGI